MGSDTTPGGIEFQFRRIKTGAKAQQAAVKIGKDPKDVDVDPKGGKCTFHLLLPRNTLHIFLKLLQARDITLIL